MENYYDALGVSADAEVEVITAAYKALMKKYHPDVCSEYNATNRSRQINEAYEVLRSPERRARYDAERASNGANQGSPFDTSSTEESTPPSPPSPPSSSHSMGPSDAGRQPEPVGRRDNGGKGFWTLGATALAIAVAGGGYILGQAPNANSSLSAHPPSSFANTIDSTALEYTARQSSGLEPNTAREIADTSLTSIVSTASSEVDEIFSRNGVSGLEVFSQNCLNLARAHRNINKTDYCVAFDMASLFKQLDILRAISPYFVARSQAFADDYNRFGQEGVSRPDRIWAGIQSLKGITPGS